MRLIPLWFEMRRGNITGALNVLVDRTEHKRAEAEWKEQFRTIVETIPECIKIVSADGKLLFMNTPGLAHGGRLFA